MWLSVFALLIILAIAFFQSIQGVFSAFIMAVLSIFAALLAFGFYENAYAAGLHARMPEYGQGVGLLAIFALALLFLRVIVDQLIHTDMFFGAWVNRIGGGAFGLITAMVMVGTLLVGLQLLPFGNEVLGFSREDANGRRKSVWLNPDGFVVGMVSQLSGTTLAAAGRSTFPDVHPDFLLEIGRSQAGVQREAVHVMREGGRLTIMDGWLLRELGEQSSPGSDIRTSRNPSAGTQWWVFQVSVSKEARDEDGQLRFSAGQVRLVGRERAGGPTVDEYPIGVNSLDKKNQHVRVKPNELVFRSFEETTFDLVFEVADNFEPWFLEFKRMGRTKVTTPEAEGPSTAAPEEAPAAAPAVAPPAPTLTLPPLNRPPTTPAQPSATGPRVSPGSGRTGGSEATDDYTGFGNMLPEAIAVDALREQGARLQGSQIQEVVDAVIPLPDRPPTGSLAVTEFAVPADKRMLQLGQDVTQAGSTLGRALQFAARSIRQARIEDSAGNAYFPIGEWVIAQPGGQRTIEIQYNPNALMPERAIRARTRPGLRDQDLKPTDPWALLFLVPPGTQIVRFTTGRSQQQLNLTAPQ